MRESDLVKEKKYIEIQYDAETQKNMRAYCDTHGLDLTISSDGLPQSAEDFDFHSTVWFTTSEHQLANQTQAVYVKASPRSLAVFGSGRPVLVLEINSTSLEHIRSQFGEAHNMQDMWPDYNPHITLSYNHDSKTPPNIPLPDFQLVATQLNIKTQKSS